MSRIGKQPIEIPQGTEVSLDNSTIVVKGKGGELRRGLNRNVSIAVRDGAVEVSPTNASHAASMLWGTYASHIRNMVMGVNEPFVKKLVIEGVGYRVSLSGSALTLNVGFSHPVELNVPEGLSVSVEKNEVTVSGADKELVGQFAAEVRAVKKPEPYKGKGIRYDTEVPRRKQGKRGTA